MARINQSGSVASFVVIGAILALLLIGGVYAVRHSLLPAREGASGVVNQPEDDTVAKDTPSTQGEEANPKDDSKEETEKDNSVAGTTPKQDESESPTTVTPAPSDAAQPGTLPETGPGASLLNAAVLSVLVAAALVYARSRQLPSSL